MDSSNWHVRSLHHHLLKGNFISSLFRIILSRISVVLSLNRRGSTIGLAGCGIWLIFMAIFGMGAENRSGKREFHLRVGAGFCVFEESGCENRKGKVAGYGISIFTRLHDLTGAG